MTDPPAPQLVTTVREHLAGANYHAAWYFADEAERHASTPTPEDPNLQLSRVRSFAIGAVLTAAAALEAKANDLFITARDLPSGSEQPEQARLRKSVEALWDEAERLSILRKYKLFLAMSDLPALNEGSSTYQAADALILLRNRLTHHKAEWETDQGEDLKIERRLRPLFTPNPLAGSKHPYFPEHCLGAGCARWAVTTVDTFAAEIATRIPGARGFTLRRVTRRPFVEPCDINLEVQRSPR